MIAVMIVAPWTAMMTAVAVDMAATAGATPLALKCRVALPASPRHLGPASAVLADLVGKIFHCGYFRTLGLLDITSSSCHCSWDVKPAGYVEGVGAPLLGADGSTADVGGASQQTRHARRVYVGGLGDVSEGEIASFFTELVTRLGCVMGTPCTCIVFIATLLLSVFELCIPSLFLQSRNHPAKECVQ